MLYHCSEAVAFWMFVAMVESFELREIYEPGLPGLYKHCEKLESLIEKVMPQMSEHFVRFLFIW